MKEKTKSKQAYMKPACEIITVSEQGNLMETSFPSQHNPAQPGNGPVPSNAKQAWFDDDDEYLSGSSQEWGSLWDD